MLPRLLNNTLLSNSLQNSICTHPYTPTHAPPIHKNTHTHTHTPNIQTHIHKHTDTHTSYFVLQTLCSD